MFCLFIVALVILYAVFSDVPGGFPTHSIVTVKNGTSLGGISEQFESRHLIRFPIVLKVAVILIGGQRGAISGDYYFPTGLSTFAVARRLVSGKHGLEPIRVTIPEGTSVKDIAKILDASLPGFDSKQFTDLASADEGYLFPDTYFFMSNASSTEIISVMEDNFSKKIIPLNADIQKFKKSLHDVVIMASILEEEARLTETRQIVAGILWKRLLIGMPLQVDSAFQYINGKNSFTLTMDDLAIDSPYNTY
ncbi:endolytic transglycosylase MltG, partial [Candidatus Parcubacteria bacterium]|nr:endolytic transglycosylase MltG [Candidatus Parcubacteria bacterium]